MGSITHFDGNYAFLSNFFPAEVELDGKIYPSVEHAYQAAKTFDPEIREKVRTLNTPNKAKQAGKSMKLRPDWENVKLGIMENLVRQKFTKHITMKANLLATGDDELVEGNWWGDRFWGVCKGSGLNHLGRILMRVREELRNGN